MSCRTSVSWPVVINNIHTGIKMLVPEQNLLSNASLSIQLLPVLAVFMVLAASLPLRAVVDSTNNYSLQLFTTNASSRTPQQSFIYRSDMNQIILTYVQIICNYFPLPKPTTIYTDFTYTSNNIHCLTSYDLTLS